MDEGGAPSILACPEELLDDLSGAYLEENGKSLLRTLLRTFLVTFARTFLKNLTRRFAKNSRRTSLKMSFKSQALTRPYDMPTRII